jgi:hypothetical protein
VAACPAHAARPERPTISKTEASSRRVRVRQLRTLRRRLAQTFPDSAIEVRPGDQGPTDSLVYVLWEDCPSLGEVQALCPASLSPFLKRTVTLRTIATVATLWWLRGHQWSPADQELTAATAAGAGPDVVRLAELILQVWQVGTSMRDRESAWTASTREVCAFELFRKAQQMGAATAAAAGLDLPQVHGADQT